MRAYNAFKVGSREITNDHQFQVYLESNLLETKKVECIIFAHYQNLKVLRGFTFAKIV